MSEHCEIRFTKAAAKELLTIAKKDPRRAAGAAGLAGAGRGKRVEALHEFRGNQGFAQESCVGEIRDLGSGGYRLFMFWHDAAHVRELWICRVLPKRDVEGKRRLNEVCEAVEELRRRFLDEDE